MSSGGPALCPGCGKVPLGVTHACYGGATWSQPWPGWAQPIYVPFAQYIARVAEIEGRLRALEQQSRGYAEDGALAAGRGAEPCMSVAERAKCSQEIARLRSRNDSLDTELGEVRTRLEAERDEWQSRARAADQEAEHHHAAGNTARAALRKIVDGSGFDAVTIASRALAGGEANEGSGLGVGGSEPTPSAFVDAVVVFVRNLRASIEEIREHETSNPEWYPSPTKDAIDKIEAALAVFDQEMRA